MEEQEIITQIEGIKLERNTKGLNWKIALLGNVDETLINRLETLNCMMMLKFGNRQDET